jgi:outer membrane PBP1 activator LpoA protein
MALCNEGTDDHKVARVSRNLRKSSFKPLSQNEVRWQPTAIHINQRNGRILASVRSSVFYQQVPRLYHRASNAYDSLRTTARDAAQDGLALRVCLKADV